MMRLTVIVALWAVCLVACGDEDSSSATSEADADVSSDVGVDVVAGDQTAVDGVVSPGTACDDGALTLNFAVDDTANKTYVDGELIWTGSFAFSELDTSLTYATSWLPEEGPYPALYDDGPRSAGGHEGEGSSADDHIWGVSVCYVADQARTLSYGVLNGDLRWIWLGPNGTLDVAEGATGVVDVPGMSIAPHGDEDLRISLDLNALHEDFAGGITTAEYGIYVKGTMNSWTPVQLLDDGLLADAEAGDGILTYEHSSSLGPHDGLLSPGQEAQFVFVFAMGDTNPDAGMEYKVDGDAALEGISARGECGDAWQDLVVEHALDSKGVTLNAAATLCDAPEDPPDCTSDDECEQNQTCADGVCIAAELVPAEIWLLVPDSGSIDGGDIVSIQGAGLENVSSVEFGGVAATVFNANAGEVIVETPPHDAGPVDVVVSLANAQGGASYPSGFTYLDEVIEDAVVVTETSPALLSPMGGTSIAVQGVGLDAACLLTLDGEPVDGATFQAGAIVFVAPRHVPGLVTLGLDCPLGMAQTELTYEHVFDGSLNDWPAATLIASNEVESDWGEDNWLGALMAGSDGETLYLGVLGKSLGADFGKNAIVVYLDTDYGAGTGVADTSTLLDETGSVDAVLGGVLKFTADGFGAELGLGCLDLADYWPGTDDPAAVDAGWRSLGTPSDLGWLTEGAVVGGEAGMEASIPLSSLLGDPTGSSHVFAIGVRVVNQDGGYTSNQALPGLAGDEAADTSGSVAVLGVDY